MKKHHALISELKAGRPVLGLLKGKSVKTSTKKTSGSDFPPQKKAHPGLRALTPFDFDEAGVDDLVHVAVRSDAK